MNMWMFWLGLMILLAIIELATMGLTTIWFAFGSLAALLATAFGGPLWLQIALFLAVSILVLLLLRPFAVRLFNKNRSDTNIGTMIGREGVVTEEINNLYGKGRATIDGVSWSARAQDEDQVIAPGTPVVVKRIEGVRAFVVVKET